MGQAQLILVPPQLGFRPTALGDVPLDGGGADQPTLGIAHRGDAEADPDPLAILADPLRLLELDALAPPQPLEELALGVVPVLRDEAEDRLSDDLRGGVAEDPLGGGIPAGHHPLERLADDCVVRGGHDGGQPRRGLRAAPGELGVTLEFLQCRLRVVSECAVLPGLLEGESTAAVRQPADEDETCHGREVIDDTERRALAAQSRRGVEEENEEDDARDRGGDARKESAVVGRDGDRQEEGGGDRRGNPGQQHQVDPSRDGHGP